MDGRRARFWRRRSATAHRPLCLLQRRSFWPRGGHLRAGTRWLRHGDGGQGQRNSGSRQGLRHDDVGACSLPLPHNRRRDHRRHVGCGGQTTRRGGRDGDGDIEHRRRRYAFSVRRGRCGVHGGKFRQRRRRGVWGQGDRLRPRGRRVRGKLKCSSRAKVGGSAGHRRFAPRARTSRVSRAELGRN